VEDTSIPPERDELVTLVERPARVVSADEVEALRLEQEAHPLLILRTPTDAEAEALGQALDREMRYARITVAPEGMYQVEQHRPRRGSDVEAWLKRRRDEWVPRGSEVHRALDGLLDEYRRRADYALPLDAPLEGTDGV
jgi:hypothetical protein